MKYCIIVKCIIMSKNAFFAGTKLQRRIQSVYFLRHKPPNFAEKYKPFLYFK
jgi:hypothetical protein